MDQQPETTQQNQPYRTLAQLPPDYSGCSILGQYVGYPRTFWQALPIVVLTFGAVIVAYILVVPGQSRVFDAVLGQKNVVYQNGEVIDQETYQFAFWTPSARTVESVRERWKDEHKQPTDLAWQEISVEEETEKLERFGQLLRGNGTLVNGYRRVAVAGHGRTNYKEGYWWTVSVDQSYNIDQFVNLYVSFWKPTKNETPHNRVYVEILKWNYSYSDSTPAK